MLEDELDGRFPFLFVLAALLPLVQLVRPLPFFIAAVAGWIAAVYLFVPAGLGLQSASRFNLVASITFAFLLLVGTLTSSLLHKLRDMQTRDKQNFAKSEQVKAHLAAIVDSSDDAIISNTLDGMITSWNKSAECLYGYSESEALGRPMTMLLPGDRLNEESILTRLAKGHRIKHMDAVRRRKDGTLVDISLTVSPILDGDGNIIGVSKTARDISERKRSEALLVEIEQRKDEFLATLAHELRNPLAAISLALHVLESAAHDPVQVRDVCSLIQRQSAQLKRLIDDLMDVGRISTGKVVLQREPFDVAEALKVVVADSQGVCNEHGIGLKVSIPENQRLMVCGDTARFAQVINNLLHNASKFTAHGGWVKVSAFNDGQQVVVVVADSGVGMHADELQRIFEMFTQVEQAPSLRTGGLGIGLSLAKSIVETHGGSIEAHSEGLGKGSQFIVRIPLLVTGNIDANGEGVDEGSTVDSLLEGVGVPATALERRKVVVADDNSDALHAVALTLRMIGHEVETAVNGLEALEKVHNVRPDVVLLDIGMPGMDGYEVARRIRREPWSTQITLIAITGWGQKRDKQQALDAGFDLHLTKPIDIQMLKQKIASAGHKAPTAGEKLWHA